MSDETDHICLTTSVEMEIALVAPIATSIDLVGGFVTTIDLTTPLYDEECT